MLPVCEIRCHLLDESTSEHILVLFVFEVLGLGLQVVLMQWLRVMMDWLWVGSEVLWCSLIWRELGLTLQWSSVKLLYWSLHLRQRRTLVEVLRWCLPWRQLLCLWSLQKRLLLEVGLEICLRWTLEMLLLLRWGLVRESNLLWLLCALLGSRMCVIIERSLILIEVRWNSLAHWGSEDWLLLLLLLNKRRWIWKSGWLIELLVTQNVLLIVPELVLKLMLKGNGLWSLWALLMLIVRMEGF